METRASRSTASAEEHAPTQPSEQGGDEVHEFEAFMDHFESDSYDWRDAIFCREDLAKAVAAVVFCDPSGKSDPSLLRDSARDLEVIFLELAPLGVVAGVGAEQFG